MDNNVVTVTNNTPETKYIIVEQNTCENCKHWDFENGKLFWLGGKPCKRVNFSSDGMFLEADSDYAQLITVSNHYCSLHEAK